MTKKKRENEFIINEIKNTLRTDIPIILEDVLEEVEKDSKLQRFVDDEEKKRK